MKDLNNYECQGQINIFDIITKEPPELLKAGQTVYTVKRGEIRTGIINSTHTSRQAEEMERFYCIKYDLGYGNISNSQSGINWFPDYVSAYFKADEYLKTHDVILKEDIKPIEVKAFTYIRDGDNREMISFYAILPNGKAYTKRFMTYEHIINYGSVEAAKKSMKKTFSKQQEFKYCNPQEADLTPKFKNMYRCHSDVAWDYAEAEYSGCI